MTILEILKYPNENLKKKASDVELIDDKILDIISNMIETMIFYKGIGLAATQINIQKKIIVINIDKQTSPLALINPKIINAKDTIIGQEGCLSFPNIFVKIKRKKIIKIAFINIKNKKNILLADHLLSICLQHEIDHLNGITLYDRMSPLKKKLIKDLK